MIRSRYLTYLPQWVIYILGLVPAVYYFSMAILNRLGADPLAVLEHSLGEWALIYLIFGLSITPLMRYFQFNLIKYRRPVGLAAFTLVALHLMVYVFLDRQLDFGDIWTDILKRPYITIGTAAFLMIVPLAVTSTNKWIRKMGPVKWRKLHMLVYPAAFCGALHYMLLVKAWPLEPIMYLTTVSGLLGLRIFWFRRKFA